MPPSDSMLVASLRQTRATALLLVRHLARRAVRGGAGPGHVPSRAPWFILLSLVWALYVGNLLWGRFAAAASHADPALGASIMGWQLFGLVLALVGFGLVELVPELGRIRPPLRIALLDELPFTTAARLVLAWFRNPFVPGLAVTGVLAWSHLARGSAGGVLGAVLLGLALYLAASTVGYALGTWVRVVASARGRRVIGIGALILVLVGVQMLVFADLLGPALAPGDLLVQLAEALRDDRATTLGLGALAAWGASLAAIAVAERRGYDRQDASPPGIRRTRGEALDAHQVERILTRREGGLGLALTGWLFFAAVAVGVGFALVHPPAPDIVRRLTLGISVAIAYLGAVIGLSRAGQAVRRDAGARAFLAPLPIAPFQTLEGKVQAIRRVLWPLLLTPAPAIALGLWHADVLGSASVEIVWRSAATVAVVWIGADAAVSIAFLTGGVGLPGVKTLGAPTSFAVQLLLLPLLAAAAAPDPVVALAAVGAVLAIAMEARRAAHHAVRWLDDAADDIERETTVWRALLALAAFYAAQALGGELLGLGGLPLPVRAALTYVAAAAVLIVLTLQGRRALGPLRLWPERGWMTLLGPIAGALSAMAALGFAALLTALGVGPTLAPTPPGAAEATNPLASQDGLWLLVAVMTVVAPIAEEIFFRGWLQSAIAADLLPSRRRYAFVIAALAFALAHVGGWVVPQLVLGLAAGALFAGSRGLLPAILAHATHNALALALAS